VAKTKISATRPTDGLWRAVTITGWIFILFSALLALGSGHRVSLLAEMHPMEPLRDLDPIPGHEAEAVILGLLSLPYLIAYVAGAFLTLRWYLRSIRNARVLHRGITISPGWVIGYFILPVVSLFRPYTMTSELWRSSQQAEGWKSLRDPALLRWWWGLVLVAGFVSLAGSYVAPAVSTASGVMTASVLTGIGFGLSALAGALFLNIGGPISRRQTALIAAGHRPAEPGIPAWSA